jgi:hypothetical protein
MSDYEFWLEIRRALITIGRALIKRYDCAAILILLFGRDIKSLIDKPKT